MKLIESIKSLIAVTALCASTAFATPANLPAGPIRIVVGFPAGGGTDILARIVANKLAVMWGIPVVVDNKAGAAGLIAAKEVAKAAPDGQTLMMGHINALGIAPALTPRLGYSADKDFTPIVMVGQTPQLLVANPKFAANLQTLTTKWKSAPGSAVFGSSGSGSAQHLALALFEQSAGISTLHVPYKGAAPVMTDLVGGQIEYAFEGMTTAAPFVKGGKVMAVAQTGLKRAKAFADIPTVAESGFPGFNASVWFGLVGPGKMSPELVTRINSDVNKILALPDVAARLEEFGAEDGGGAPERFDNFMKAERLKWAKLVQTRAIKIEE